MRAIPTLLICLFCLFLMPAGHVHAQESEPGAAPETERMEEPSGSAVDVERVAEDVSERMSGYMTRLTGEWGQIQVAGIELWRYLSCLVFLFLTFMVAQLVKVILEKYGAQLAAKTRWQMDDMLFKSANRPAALFIVAIGIYLSALPLLVTFGATLNEVFARVFLAVAAAAVLWYVYRVVGVLDHYLRRFVGNTGSEFDDTFVDITRKTLRIFVVIVGVLFIGQAILNMDLTTLIASAGVLGLAIAFAAQDTIANLFGSFMLLLDRPFKVGDRIVLEGADGPVEALGIRSTRVRTLDGHLVSVPNKTVASTKIQNIGKRPHIKRVSNITITYDTPVEKVQRALRIVRDILDNHEGMDPEWPPRVYFNEFNDCSLNILLIAWYHPPEYWDYLQWCENTNLAIMRAFEDEGIEFAFPTTTTYLAQDDRRPLTIATKTIMQNSQDRVEN